MAISYYTDFEPTYGEVVQLAPLVRRVVAKNPNPFTWKGTGVYLIGRGEDIAVIDPGPTLDEHLDAIVGALAEGETITKILVTHTHTDHTAGIPKLVERTGATIYGFGPHGPVPEHDPLESVTFDEYFTAEEKATIEKEWADIPDELKREGPDVDFKPDVVVGHGATITGGSGANAWTVEVVHTPGHTSNHICFGLQDDGDGKKALFTGDHVMGWATSVISPPDGDLFDYMNSLRILLDRDDDLFWPTHGTAITDPKPYVESFLSHRMGREHQIMAALGEKSSTIKDLVPAMYAEVDKRLWRAAANSVYSHLLALHREGRAAPVEGEPSLVATWQLV
ncbi:MAG: glyoxylase-like metal-dependent hydrolase (beta-lactamase superfamily II) [Acidimicrobiales bacterium]|jgi:glyoxylase-like metal-dependent hydrolase (beta-lactamase superfamily II)